MMPDLGGGVMESATMAPILPATEAMLTMRPPPCFSIAGSRVLMTR